MYVRNSKRDQLEEALESKVNFFKRSNPKLIKTHDEFDVIKKSTTKGLVMKQKISKSLVTRVSVDALPNDMGTGERRII